VIDPPLHLIHYHTTMSSVRSGITADSVFDWGNEREIIKKLAIDCRGSQFRQWAETSTGSLTTVEQTQQTTPKTPPTEQPKPSVEGRFESPNRRLTPNNFKDLTDLVNEDSDDSDDEDLDLDIEMPPVKSRSSTRIIKPNLDPYSLHKQVLVFALIISVLIGGLIALGVEISSTHPEEYAHELEGQSTKESHRNGPQRNKSADPPHPSIHQSDDTDLRGIGHSQPSDGGPEYLPSTSAEYEQAVEKSSAIPPQGATDSDGLTYQQYLLEEAELVSERCSTDRMQCEQVCQYRMCCFEEDEEKSCIEDTDMACPAYVGCGVLLEGEVAEFRSGQ